MGFIFDTPSPPSVSVPDAPAGVDTPKTQEELLAELRKRKQIEADRRGIDSLRIEPAQPVGTGVQVR